MPCDLDVTITEPPGPSGPKIPGFGSPFSLNIPTIPIKDGFPENLLEFFDSLSLTLPPGVLKPALSKNYGKDIFDSLLSLLDKFMPFLMLYKFFMPILNIIVCILEVLCSLMNPFKLRRAVRRLFRRCIPDFLNMFPIFAIVVMLISLLLLLLALIEYIIDQIRQLIDLIKRNLESLKKAIQDGDASSILAITAKIGSVLCIFQNLFVLLSLFTSIFEVIRDILNIGTNIPPCNDSGSGDPDDCCTTDVCPSIVLQNYTRVTGSLLYLRKINVQEDIGNPNFQPIHTYRDESWQLYDFFQELPEEFRNITDPYDVPDIEGVEKPSFFPTDGSYTKDSSPRYAPYTVDLKIFYQPSIWGRTGNDRNIIFKDCIVTVEPQLVVDTIGGTIYNFAKGVLKIEGGKGYELNGAILYGYSDSNELTGAQATLNNFFHYPERTALRSSFTPPNGSFGFEVLQPTDGYLYDMNVEYTFKPNMDYLFSKQMITAGCFPDLALDREVVNQAYGNDVAVLTSELKNIFNNGFPNTNQAQTEMEVAINSFRNDVSTDSLDTLSRSLNASLDKLRDDTSNTIDKLITSGVSPCNSKVSISDKIQFTSKDIKVNVTLNERNGISITNGVNIDIMSNIAKKIKAYPTLGVISSFYPKNDFSFEAILKSEIPGNGQISVSFDEAMLCSNNIPEDLSIQPSIDIQLLNYVFVDAGGSAGSDGIDLGSGVDGSTTGTIIDQNVTSPQGQPRRDSSDTSNEGES